MNQPNQPIRRFRYIGLNPFGDKWKNLRYVEFVGNVGTCHFTDGHTEPEDSDYTIEWHLKRPDVWREIKMRYFEIKWAPKIGASYVSYDGETMRWFDTNLVDDNHPTTHWSEDDIRDALDDGRWVEIDSLPTASTSPKLVDLGPAARFYVAQIDGKVVTGFFLDEALALDAAQRETLSTQREHFVLKTTHLVAYTQAIKVTPIL